MKSALTSQQIDFAQLRVTTVEPVIAYLRLPCQLSAINLLLGTCAVESAGTRRMQSPSGPARSLLQIEPATHDDLWVNFLPSHPDLAALLGGLVFPAFSRIVQLACNDAYAFAVARLIYLRAEPPLPAPNDIRGLGAYWKDHYNTAGGAGSVDMFEQAFKTHIGDPYV